ncbi:MAG: PP2C family protein-serine/threonine phosphatase [Bacteroidota bacterium]
MNQRKLYHILKSFASDRADTEEHLLSHVLEQIVRNENIEIKGGRIWKLDPQRGKYRLVEQRGEIEKIKDNYGIKIETYPIFFDIAKNRTVLAKETNQYFRRKGILRYSAVGIGEKVLWKQTNLYPYIFAFNAEDFEQSMFYTLGIIGSALTSLLKSRRVEAEALQLEEDLDKAREIQRSILPEHEVRFHNYELYGISIPDRIVGGDFFDYLEAGEVDRLGVVIGDATSKGLSAAAHALYISGALRMGFEYQSKIPTLLGKVNRLMNRMFSEEHFVSLFYGEFVDDKRGLMVYANAGHNNPILLHTKSGDIETLEPTGQILGPFPEERYRTESITIDPGDILLLYTDGISEAVNDRSEMYGEERLKERLKAWKNLSAKEIAQLFIEDAQAFNTHQTYTDDKTVVVVKRLQ